MLGSAGRSQVTTGCGLPEHRKVRSTACIILLIQVGAEPGMVPLLNGCIGHWCAATHHRQREAEPRPARPQTGHCLRSLWTGYQREATSPYGSELHHAPVEVSLLQGVAFTLSCVSFWVWKPPPCWVALPFVPIVGRMFAHWPCVPLRFT